MKKKQTLYEWLTKKFVLNIRNSENMALIKTFKISWAKILVVFFVLFLVISMLNFFIFNFMTGYASEKLKVESNFKINTILLLNKIDSLETEVAHKDSFILRFQNILKLN